MEYSFFHWAFHPWAISAIIRAGSRLLHFPQGDAQPRQHGVLSVAGPVRVYGPIGKTIDILAVFATLFGSATSLGLGALQINQGLNAVFGIGGRDAVGLAIVVIAVLTLCFIFRRSAGYTAASSGSLTPIWCLPFSCCFSCSLWDRRCSS